jgi:hypothetical protein
VAKVGEHEQADQHGEVGQWWDSTSVANIIAEYYRAVSSTTASSLLVQPLYRCIHPSAAVTVFVPPGDELVFYHLSRVPLHTSQM